MSAKKARQLRFSDEENSSSGDDEPLSSMQKTPDHRGDEVANVSKRGSRSSDRIHRKRNREFRMPTREDVLKDIPDIDSPNKSLTHLKPRKLINDYTRVTNRYNQRGDNEWSSDSESNFIVNDDVEYETNTDSSWESDREERKKAAKKPKRGKVKRLRRISKPSSSDSESCEEKKDADNESQEAEQPKNNGMTSKNGQGKGDESTEGEEEEEEEETIAAKKKHNKTVIESDEESEEDEKSFTPQTTNSANNPTDANASDTNAIAATSAAAAGDQNEAIRIESGSGESESGSDESESGSGESESDSGDNERGNSKRARLMKKRKDSWLKKFEQYKELKKAKTKKS